MADLNNADFFREVLDSLLTGVYVVDNNGKVLLWNTGAERITGYLRQDVVGHMVPADAVSIPESAEPEPPEDVTPIVNTRKDGKPHTAHVSFLHRAGHRLPGRLFIVPLRDTRNTVVGAVGSFSENLADGDPDSRESKLQQYGCLDPISGVLSHGMVEAHLREVLATFAEHPTPFSILCIAIDDLDSIRARNGQAAIDAMVRVVGQTVGRCLRPTDFVGRWLENEFMAILMECSEDEVQFVAKRVRGMVLQAKVQWWGDPLSINISMGSASAREGDTSVALIARAEASLGKNLQPTASFAS